MDCSVLLRGGLVCDPGTDTASIMDVLIFRDRIVAVGNALHPPEHCEVIDVTGMIVGPGFIDLHSHVHSIAGQRLQAFDGVTSSLDLEVGIGPVSWAYESAAQQGRPLNYGFSASWSAARAHVLLGDSGDFSFERTLALLGNPAWQRNSSPRELAGWLSVLETELEDGALGIGVLLGYAPDTNPAEFLAVAAVAASADAPVYVHVRDLIEINPNTPIDGSEELVVAAGQSGGALHHCHVNSTSIRHLDRVSQMLGRSQREGARVTVEAYPYGAGSTSIGAAFLSPEGLSARGLSPSSIIVAQSGHRISDESELLALRARSPEAECFIEWFNEDDPAQFRELMASFDLPGTIVASDSMPLVWADGQRESLEWPLPAGGRTHPRTAGTYSKSLRLLVRGLQRWDWLEAFRRCSYLPARILDPIAPSARRKGILGPGADADILVLDPKMYSDAATFLAPTRPARGVRHLLVNGTFVLRDGQLDENAFPGRAIRGEPK